MLSYVAYNNLIWSYVISSVTIVCFRINVCVDTFYLFYIKIVRIAYDSRTIYN